MRPRISVLLIFISGMILFACDDEPSGGDDTEGTGTADTDTDTDADTDTDTDTDTDIDTDTDTDTDSDADSDTDTDTDNDTDSDSAGDSDTGSNANASSVVFEEGDVCDFKGDIETEHSGYKGAGYINADNEAGAGIVWSVDVGTAGDLELTFRYSLEEGNRVAVLMLDGAPANTIAFSSTGGWTTWDIMSHTLTVEAGTHLIELSAAADAGLANIDSLSVTGPGVAAGTCGNDGDTDTDTDTGSGPDTGEEDTNPLADCTVPAEPTGPTGYGKNTTGGGNASPVVVSSFEQAESALAAYRDAFKNGSREALVIRYNGKFDFSSITDVCAQHSKDARILQIKEMENVTFEGTAGSSANFGIKVNRAKNVIIRNMTMGLLPGGGDSDAITLEGNGTNGDVENVWIHHNELFSSTRDDCDGAGDTEFDGLIDIKKGARYITISWNHLHDHQKTGLIGHTDDDATDSSGAPTERYVTFHHNWYSNVVSRTPLQRFGFTHLFNNYYNEILSSGINVRMGGIALVEANYFEYCENPITSRYSDVAGYWDLRDNYVGAGITWSVSDDTLANADDWESTGAAPAGHPNYSYQPDDAECVKQIVSATAGATLSI